MKTCVNRRKEEPPELGKQSEGRSRKEHQHDHYK